MSNRSATFRVVADRRFRDVFSLKNALDHQWISDLISPYRDYLGQETEFTLTITNATAGDTAQIESLLVSLFLFCSTLTDGRTTGFEFVENHA